MIRIAITMLAGIAGITLGTYCGIPHEVSAPMLVGFLALAIVVAHDLRRDLPPATRMALWLQRRRLRAKLPRERWVPMARDNF